MWILMTLMSAAQAAPPASAPPSNGANARLTSILTGPECADVSIVAEQTASMGWLWSDREVFHVQGRLRRGAWTFASWTKVQDVDPSETLETGAYPFAKPGIGVAPGEVQLIDPAAIKAPMSVRADHWRWSVPGGTIDMVGGDLVKISLPARRAEADGSWIEHLEWSVKVDAQGRPVEERGTADVGDQEGSVKVEWKLDFDWSKVSCRGAL